MEKRCPERLRDGAPLAASRWSPLRRRQSAGAIWRLVARWQLNGPRERPSSGRAAAVCAVSPQGLPLGSWSPGLWGDGGP